ncbi:MAG: iron-sulfur cluster assembly protein [Bacteroidota bacterium]
MKTSIINILKNIFDPELPVNIYDLGLIYEINISESKDVEIVMTLTAPNCPMAEDIVLDIEKKIKKIDGTAKVTVKVTFDPPWNKNRMTEEALLELGLL